MEDKLYTTSELREEGIYTDDFLKMDEPCEVVGTLALKAYGDKKTIRNRRHWKEPQSADRDPL